MKILAVAPDGPVFPVGLAYVVTALKAAGHSVNCVNLKLTKACPPPIGYDFLATGGLIAQNKQITEILSIAKNAGVATILGGGIVSSEPELVTRRLGVTYSVLGEGEESVVGLLDCIERGGNLESVPGIAFIKNDQFVMTTPRAAIADLDRLPFPDYEAFGFENHLNQSKSSDSYYSNLFDYFRPYPLVASRSCPFHCTFCYHPLGKKYRQRSIDSIMAELEERVEKYRINYIEIMDELFCLNEQHLADFCSRIRELASRLTWKLGWGCQFRVDSITQEKLSMVKAAGCVIIGYGFESYSALVLKSMKKQISPEEIDRSITLTVESQICFQANFIFGDFAETEETANETLRYWMERPEAKGIWLGFVLAAPDAEIYRRAIKEKIIEDKAEFLDHFTERIYNLTSMPMSSFIRLRIKVLRKQLFHVFYAWPTSVDGNVVTVRCPHCKQKVVYRNFDVTDERMTIFGRYAGRLAFSKVVYCRKCMRRFWIRNWVFTFAAPIFVTMKGLQWTWNSCVAPKLLRTPAQRWISAD